MRHRLILRGCSAEPMAGYLKALGVFRLVSEQADPEARGSWSGSLFCLDSKLDAETLTHLFLDEYAPTPIVAPWNGGSGFSEGERREGIDGILASESPRMSEYRRTLEEIFSWPEFSGGDVALGQMLAAVQRIPKGRAKNDALKLVETIEQEIAGADRSRDTLLKLTTAELKTAVRALGVPVRKLRTLVNKNTRSAGKEEIVRACRNRLSDRAVAWLDCAVVLRTANELRYPPLLGTGGGDGRLDYTNAFMERVNGLLLKAGSESESLLRNALFEIPTEALANAAVGQYDPGRAGGFNQVRALRRSTFRRMPGASY